MIAVNENELEPAAEDLEVPADDSADVKGGALNAYMPGGVQVAAGDVNGDNAAAKLPGLHKSTDVTLKRG